MVQTLEMMKFSVIKVYFYVVSLKDAFISVCKKIIFLRVPLKGMS